MLHVIATRVLPDFRIWLRFNDDTEGVADLSGELDGPVFGPLRDPAVFATAHLDAAIHTVAWPNGADLAPEFLQSLVTGSSQASATS